MGAKPPFNGTLGTDSRPTVIETELIELLTSSAGSLVGVAEGATSTDGTVIYPSGSDPQGVPTDLAVQIDGTSRPVTAMEYIDGNGTARPVSEWHLGPLGEFELTLDNLAFVDPATFDVAITSAGSAQPGGTLDVTVDVTNTGDETGTQTVALDINNGVGQVDSQSVTLSGGGSTTQTLSWSVPSGQTEQDYQATVSSADDTASQTVTVGLPDGAVSRYEFEQDVTDSWSGNDATDNTTVGYSTDSKRGGFAKAFNSSGNVIVSSTDFDTNEFTITGWVKFFNADRFPRVFWAGDYSSATLDARLYYHSNDVEWKCSAGNGSVNGGSASNNVYYFFAVRVQNGTLELFIDNSSIGSTNITPSNNGDDLSFARRANDLDPIERLDGLLDDMRFYNSGISNSRISDIYNGNE